MECLSYCIANAIDLTKLDNHCKSNIPTLSSLRTRDVLRLSFHDKAKRIIFVFKNGTIVSWGVKRHQIKAYVDVIMPFADKFTSLVQHDEFSYKVGISTFIEPHEYFDVDCLMIEEDSDELKLSCSYGFSQSVKLQYFESIIDSLIEKYTPMIQSLSQRGHMPLSRNKIRQIIGEILGAKSEMNLISNFLYHPKYFWQHPSLEVHYAMLERYLHIPRRINTINHRLDTLNEIFDMFNDYLENKHAHRLEIIIIVLIVIEIIFAILNTHI